jgi:uncharacterized membrane protein
MKLSSTLIKTLSYAFMHMAIAIILAYIISGSWQVALAIGLIEPFVQTIAFFFHEKAWHKHERKHHKKDHHNDVIDSVSPATTLIEKILHHRH